MKLIVLAGGGTPPVSVIVNLKDKIKNDRSSQTILQRLI